MSIVTEPPIAKPSRPSSERRYGGADAGAVMSMSAEIARLPCARISVGTLADAVEANPPTVVALLARGLAAPEAKTADAPMFVAVAVGVDIIAALSIALPLVLDRALCEARMRPRRDARREVSR